MSSESTSRWFQHTGLPGRMTNRRKTLCFRYQHQPRSADGFMSKCFIQFSFPLFKKHTPLQPQKKSNEVYIQRLTNCLKLDVRVRDPGFHPFITGCRKYQDVHSLYPIEPDDDSLNHKNHRQRGNSECVDLSRFHQKGPWRVQNRNWERSSFEGSKPETSWSNRFHLGCIIHQAYIGLRPQVRTETKPPHSVKLANERVLRTRRQTLRI